MTRCTLMGFAVLLTVSPALGQQIIQRMERDIVVAAQPEQQLPDAPLLSLEELRRIALLSGFGKELRSEESGILRRTALRLSQRDYARARQDWELALGKMREREFEPDLDALIRGVLQQAYIDKNDDLRALAAAVRFRERQREAAYKERSRWERIKVAADEGNTPSKTGVPRLVLAESYAPGVQPVEWASQEELTAESVAEELQRVVVLCNTADENARLDVARLQQALEGQTLQTISNAFQMLHDAATAMIM